MVTDTTSTRSNRKILYIIGGVAALLQLAILFAMMIVMATLGPRPIGAEEYFAIQQVSKLEVVLRGDFVTLILIGMYLGTFPALYVALRRVNPIYTALAALFTFIAVTLAFASESTFSLLHLGDQYGAATTEAERAQLLAAGEAIIAADLWHSSGMYVAGMLLQGAGVMISVVMLRSEDFSKVTAYAGLLGNALDLFQHIVHPFAPSVMDVVSPVMGIFYMVWFPMLARDLFRLQVSPHVPHHRDDPSISYKDIAEQ
jgi:hypothetical protein